VVHTFFLVTIQFAYNSEELFQIDIVRNVALRNNVPFFLLVLTWILIDVDRVKLILLAAESTINQINFDQIVGNILLHLLNFVEIIRTDSSHEVEIAELSSLL